MPNDLNLKTVIEAVLDAKGFEDFQAAVKQTKTTTDSLGPSVEQTGGSFNRLGNRLPHTAFKLMSYDLIENMGLQGHLRPLVMLSSTAMDGLAASTGLMSNMLVGATLGISLLVPLLMSMRKGTDESGTAAKDFAASAKPMLDKLEELREKSGKLTEQNQRLYESLKAYDDLQKQIELRDLDKQIDELRQTLHKQVLESDTVRFGTTEAAVAFRDLGYAATEMDPKLRSLVEQERQLKGELDGTRKSIEAQIKSQDKLAEAGKKSAQARHAADRHVAEQADAFLKHEEKARQMRLADERADFKKRQADIAAGERANEAGARRYIALEKEKQRADQETARIEKQLRQDKEQAEFALASASIALLGAEFGQRKAFAIADAIVRTWAGATRAFEDYPWPTSGIVAATVAAEGLANVITIQKTNPSGFDDAVSDALVVSAFKNFGRKWGRDMTSLASGGAMEGFSEQMRGFGASQGRGSVVHQTTKIDRGTHIQNMTFNGAYFSPRQAMVEMERRRIRIERVENRTRRRSV